MIQKFKQQDIDREGQRLLRESLEPLGWVLTEFKEDYGIDYDVQVFADGSATGLWFKIQLKSSASSSHSTDGSFISVQLDIDHAKHYALELKEPLFLIHADLQLKKVYWHALQLDNELVRKIMSGIPASTITVRIPISNSIPDTAAALLQASEKISIVLANRSLAGSSLSSFAESLKYQPGEDKLREEFQHKNDLLKLRKIHEFLILRQYSEARARALAISSDPDASIENRFWAAQKTGTINWSEAVSKDRPQVELPLIYLRNAKDLQALTKSGPPHLKFFALTMRKAAELDQLTMNN